MGLSLSDSMEFRTETRWNVMESTQSNGGLSSQHELNQLKSGFQATTGLKFDKPWADEQVITIEQRESPSKMYWSVFIVCLRPAYCRHRFWLALVTHRGIGMTKDFWKKRRTPKYLTRPTIWYNMELAVCLHGPFLSRTYIIYIPSSWFQMLFSSSMRISLDMSVASRIGRSSKSRLQNHHWSIATSVDPIVSSLLLESQSVWSRSLHFPWYVSNIYSP